MFMELASQFYNYLFNSDTRFYYLCLLVHKNSEDIWYSIHGFWPQYNKTSYPSFCKKVEFDISKLNPIINDLNTYWKSGIEKNSDFWKHEYEKHGSCVFTNMTEFEYFNKTLELYHKAIDENLTEKYSENGKCMIPVDLNFNFM